MVQEPQNDKNAKYGDIFVYNCSVPQFPITERWNLYSSTVAQSVLLETVMERPMRNLKNLS